MKDIKIGDLVVFNGDTIEEARKVVGVDYVIEMIDIDLGEGYSEVWEFSDVQFIYREVKQTDQQTGE